MRRIFFLLALLLCGRHSLAAEAEFYLLADADAYAEPVSVRAFTGDWGGAFKGGDKAFLEARLESGFRYGRSTLAYTWRYTYLLDFNEDTAHVYYRYKNQLPMAAGEQRQLDITARHYEAQGVRLAHEFPLADSSWSLQLGLSLLQGRELTDGSLQGSAVFEGGAIATDTVRQLDGEINYHYSRPLLREEELDWNPAAPQGQGYSLDLGLSGDFSGRLHFRMQVNDALGYLYWEQAPATRYTVACECSQGTYDATGQLQLDARYRQRLPFSGQARMSYDLALPWQGFVRAQANPLATFTAAGLAYRQPGWFSSLAYELETRAVEFQLQGKYLGLRWLADKLDSDEAHRLAASLYAQYRW